MKRKIDYLFLGGILLILVVLITSFFVKPKEFSFIENRLLINYPYFSFHDFKTGVFQDQLEDSIADQSFGSETLKLRFNQSKSFIKFKGINYIAKLKPEILKDYIALNDNISIYRNEDYLLKKPMNLVSFKQNVEEFSKNYSDAFKDVETYYYFITTSAAIDFNEKGSENKYFYELEKNFKNLSRLELNSYEKHKEFYYKTDHHWNHKGSYTAYKDISSLLKINSKKTIEYEEEVVFPIYFRGSYGRELPFFKSQELFTVYKYNLKQAKIYINKVEKNYGEQENYFNDKYSKSKYVNHYGLFYGIDYGEIIFDFENNKKENLLIISNSFSNSINHLIASHFNKTFIVDLRHYENDLNESFNANDYVKKNNIDKVLIIMDSSLISSKDFKLKGDK